MFAAEGESAERTLLSPTFHSPRDPQGPENPPRSRDLPPRGPKTPPPRPRERPKIPLQTQGAP